VSDELGPELSYHYLQLIGICQWVIELGCIDIGHEISLLSQPVSGKPKGWPFGCFVSCVCIFEELFGYGMD
jgi:hypothetical protein